MITAFALLSQYDGKIIVPVADVCRDFFTHLNVEGFKRKVLRGEIRLPLVRLDDSAKTAVGVHVETWPHTSTNEPGRPGGRPQRWRAEAGKSMLPNGITSST